HARNDWHRIVVVNSTLTSHTTYRQCSSFTLLINSVVYSAVCDRKAFHTGRHNDIATADSHTVAEAGIGKDIIEVITGSRRCTREAISESGRRSGGISQRHGVYQIAAFGDAGHGYAGNRRRSIVVDDGTDPKVVCN